MALVHMKDMLAHAYAHRYTVSAFDLVSLDYLGAIMAHAAVVEIDDHGAIAKPGKPIGPAAAVLFESPHLPMVYMGLTRYQFVEKRVFQQTAVRYRGEPRSGERPRRMRGPGFAVQQGMRSSKVPPFFEHVSV